MPTTVVSTISALNLEFADGQAITVGGEVEDYEKIFMGNSVGSSER